MGAPELLILILLAMVVWTTYRLARAVARRINPPIHLTLGATNKFAVGDIIVVNNDRRTVVAITGQHSLTVRRPWPWERS